MAVAFSERYTRSAKQVVLYTDIRNNFTIHPSSKDLVLNQDAEVIKQSIINLLKTQPFERPFQPNLGSALNTLLFENFTSSTLFTAETNIRYLIDQYEPRAAVTEVFISPGEDEYSVYIRIIFSMINNTTPINLELTLKKVR